MKRSARTTVPARKRRQNTMLDLVEKIRCVHQRQRQARHGVFRQQFVDVASHQIRAAQSAGLYGESFGFQPLLQQRNLRRAPGAVHAFDHDQAAGDFAGIKADQRLRQKNTATSSSSPGAAGFAAAGSGAPRRCVSVRRHGWRARIFLSLFPDQACLLRTPERAGAKRFRSIFDATMSRICFCSLFTGSVPSSTTKLSESTILSYSSRMRA